MTSSTNATCIPKSRPSTKAESGGRSLERTRLLSCSFGFALSEGSRTSRKRVEIDANDPKRTSTAQPDPIQVTSLIQYDASAWAGDRHEAAEISWCSRWHGSAA